MIRGRHHRCYCHSHGADRVGVFKLSSELVPLLDEGTLLYTLTTLHGTSWSSRSAAHIVAGEAPNTPNLNMFSRSFLEMVGYLSKKPWWTRE